MILKGKKVCDEETGIIYTVIFVKESENIFVLRKVENQNCNAEMTVQELVDKGYYIEFQTDDNKESPIEWFRRMISSEDVKNRRIAVRFDAINGIPKMGEVKKSVINAALTDPDEEVRVAAYQTIKTMGWLDVGIQEAYVKGKDELSEIKKRDEALGFHKLPYVKCEKKYESALDGSSLLGIVAEKEQVVIVMWHLKNISKEKFRKQFKARFPKYKNMRNDELNKLYTHYLYLCENQREQLKKEWDIRNSRIKKDLPEEVQLLIEECGLRVLRSDGRGTAREVTPIQKKNYDCHTLSGYRLVDVNGNTVAGRKYELYEQDVYEFCQRYKEYLKVPPSKEATEDKIQKPKKPHTSKFKVGQTWYMAMKGNPHQCIDVTILEIVSDNRVRVRYNTKKAPEYVVNWAKLHKTPDKTMESRKDKDRANREMEEKKIKSMQQGIRKELIAKVARLSEKGTVYLNEHGNYIIKHVPYFSGGTIKSEEELEKLVDEKLYEIDKIYKKLANMKYILIHDGRGEAIYHINSISKKKHQINCSWCQKQEEIDLSKIIDGRELYMCKIQKNDWMERKRNRYLAQSVTKTK